MKKLLGILILGLLLQGCGPPSNYSGYKNYWQKRGFDYSAKACPANGRYCSWYAAHSQAEANRGAVNACNRRNSYCVVFIEGNRTVADKEDAQIAKARNVCRKIGLSPGTSQFTDCTIKMMVAPSSGGQQTIIVGQQRRSIYPLHCRQMGGASAC